MNWCRVGFDDIMSDGRFRSGKAWDHGWEYDTDAKMIDGCWRLVVEACALPLFLFQTKRFSYFVDMWE